MALKPLNDLCKVELEEAGAFSARAGDTATDGILRELPEHLTHYGFYSFAFENSFTPAPTEPGGIDSLLEYWKPYIGKRVYWLALQEKGGILKEDSGKRYCYIKLTSLLAWSEPDEYAESILDQHGGSYSA